jgi:uncharacterized protein
MMLTGDELFNALGALHDAHPAGEAAPFLGYIDGAMAAVVVSPEPIPPEEWLSRLDLAPDTLFLAPEAAARWRELLLDRQAEITASLLLGGLGFAPIYECDENDESIWQPWLMGFMAMMKLRQKAWDKLFKSKDEDLATALMGLVALAATFPGVAAKVPQIADDFADIPEMAEQAADLIPYFVEVIYRRRHGLPRVVLTDGWGFDDEVHDPHEPVRIAKVGRNEPCPCGSGKKYKKCCGR